MQSQCPQVGPVHNTEPKPNMKFGPVPPIQCIAKKKEHTNKQRFALVPLGSLTQTCWARVIKNKVNK